MKARFLIIILVIISCKQQLCDDFSNDKLLHQIFTTTEIKSLNNLLSFYDTHVIKTTQIMKIDEAYHAYFENLDSAYNYDMLYERLNYNEESIDSLMKELKKQQTWDKIYMYEYGLSRDGMDTISFDIAPNRFGKYMVLLDSLSKDSRLFAETKKTLDTFGGIIPAAAWFLPFHHDSIEFNCDRIRFICAIEMLTLPNPKIFD